MNKKICISLACALALGANAADLGTISVESSTIDDKFESKKTDVSNIATIDSDDIKEINPQSIYEVLNSIPGITAQQSEGDIVKLHIRGIGNEVYMGEKPGIAVIIDGVPVQETTGKINVDLDNVSSIKIIKGGASYLYGNDALSGAIIITTKRPKGESSSAFETEIGSFGYKRVLASTNQSFENSAFQLQGTHRETDGYWDNAYAENKSINGKYQYYIDETSDITFGADYTKRKSGDGSTVSGLTAAQTNPKSVGEVSYSGEYDSTLIKTFITYSKNFEDESNFMFNIYKFSDDKTNESARTNDNTQHDYLNDEKWVQNGIKSEFRKSFDTFAIMTGLDIQRNTIDSQRTPLPWADGFPAPSATSSSTNEDINAIYTEVQHQTTQNLKTTFNIRFDNLKYDYKDNFDNTNNVTPSYNTGSYRVGLNYNLQSGNNIYASIATGFSAPTASQISSNKDGGYTIDIDPEETINYEVGYRGNNSGYDYEASVYQLDRNKYIGYSNGNYSWGDYFDNIGDIRSRGFELALNSDKKQIVSFNLAYTYLDSKFKKYSYRGSNPVAVVQNLSGNYVARTSKHTVNVIVDYKPTSQITISPELVVKGSYFADDTNRFKQKGYEVVNLRGNYKVTKSLEFFARIDNILDETYYQFVNVSSDIGSTMEDATIRVAPSRAYYAGLRYKF
jgi:iron complex outermembrane receptor protein